MAYLRLTHPSSSSLDLSSHLPPVLELTPLFPRPSPSVSAPSTPPRSSESRFVEDEEATPVNSGGHGEEVVESGWAGVSTLRRDVKCVPLSPFFFFSSLPSHTDSPLVCLLGEEKAPSQKPSTPSTPFKEKSSVRPNGPTQLRTLMCPPPFPPSFLPPSLSQTGSRFAFSSLPSLTTPS